MVEVFRDDTDEVRTDITNRRTTIGIARRGTQGELDPKPCVRYSVGNASLLRHRNDHIR